MDNRPIGIFDSGMGGLTVRAAVAHALPHESLVYFGDGANVPYGPRPRHEIIQFVDEAIRRLIEEHDVKMVVVACNAATGAAIDHLRTKYAGRNIPIVGMEPAVKPAALTTRTGTIGVLATAAAFRGPLYRATSEKYRGKINILETVGEGFVELVETDRENTPEALETVRRALEPMLAAEADRIVLGCTHYPFLAPQIRRVIDRWWERRRYENENDKAETTSEKPLIVDSAPAIARRTGQLLMENNMQADPGRHSSSHLFLSFAGEDYLTHLARKSEKVPLI